MEKEPIGLMKMNKIIQTLQVNNEFDEYKNLNQFKFKLLYLGFKNNKY